MSYNKSHKGKFSPFESPVVEKYLEGLRVNSKGIPEPLNQPINKYNRKMLEEVKDINSGFYKLIRFNMVSIKLIQRYHGDIPEIRNLNNMIYSQSGTIRYNAVFKQALKTYGIVHGNVYRALQRDIDKQRERLSRNIQISKMLLDEVGLNKIYKEVEDSTSMKIEDYLDYLEENSRLVKPSYLEEEAEKKYYEDLTNYQLGAIIGILDSHKVEIDCNIQESLLNNRKRLKKDKKVQVNLVDQTRKKISRLMSNIQRDLQTSYFESLCILSRHEATELAYTIEKMGKQVYCIVMARIDGASVSEIYYCDKSYSITFNLLEMKLFENKKIAEDAIEQLHKKYDADGVTVITEIYRLMGTLDLNDKAYGRVAKNAECEETNENFRSTVSISSELDKVQKLYDNTEPGISKLKLGNEMRILKEELEKAQAQEKIEQSEKDKGNFKEYNKSEMNNISIERGYNTKSSTKEDEGSFIKELWILQSRANYIAHRLRNISNEDLDQYSIMDELDNIQSDGDTDSFECDSQEFMNFYTQCMSIDKKVKDTLSDCKDTFLMDSINSYKRLGKKSIFIVSLSEDTELPLQYFSSGISSSRIYKKVTNNVSNATVFLTRTMAKNSRDKVLASLHGTKTPKTDYPFYPLARVTEIKL